MKIYLANTAYGKATYSPESKTVVCPSIIEDEMSSSLEIDFFPQQQTLMEAFNQRIKRPKYNETFYDIKIVRGLQLKPLPVKYTDLSQNEAKSFNQMIIRMRLVPEISLSDVSKFTDGKLSGNLEDAIKNFEAKANSLKLLKEYNGFYAETFKSAAWLGSSEKAAKWYLENHKR